MIELLTVGCANYAIYHKTDLADDVTLGEVDFDQHAIAVRSNMSKAVLAVTLWHEALHIILRQCGWKEPHEERLVEMLAYHLAELVQDNPDLVDLTHQALVEKIKARMATALEQIQDAVRDADT